MPWSRRMCAVWQTPVPHRSMSHPSSSDASAAGWHSLLNAAAAVGPPAVSLSPAVASPLPSSVASASYFQLLYRDGLQSILSFLSSDDLWSARRGCAAWHSAAMAERRRRLISMQAEVLALINSDAAAGAAWKELCAASDPAADLSLQSNVMAMLMRCVRQQRISASAKHAVSEGQIIAAHKLVGCVAHADTV